jgi:hypothetical protein
MYLPYTLLYCALILVIIVFISVTVGAVTTTGDAAGANTDGADIDDDDAGASAVDDSSVDADTASGSPPLLTSATILGSGFSAEPPGVFGTYHFFLPDTDLKRDVLASSRLQSI